MSYSSNMEKRLLARKEAPNMSQGNLLETVKLGKKNPRPVECYFDFKGNKGYLAAGSVVTALGELKSYVTSTGPKATYLKVMSTAGVCWIRVKYLVQHRPGVAVDESRVIEHPKRKSGV